MLFRSSTHPFALLILLFLCLAAFPHCLRAQSPEGPQIPSPDTKIGTVHGQVRLGYYALTHTYRYHGEYIAQVNFARVAQSPLYGFADVDVQSLEDSAHGKFVPDRLVGTFEVGVRRLLGVSHLSLLIRHQSAHYIDRIDPNQGSWDMDALRWQQDVGKTRVSATLGNYFHIHNLDSTYQIDGDLQGITSLGTVKHRPIELRTDIHTVTGHGGGGAFTDYWIEPNMILSTQTAFFVGYGQIHDTKLLRGNADHPIITGFRLLF